MLPALPSRLGDRVDRGRVPLVRRLRRDDGGEGRIWGADVNRVLRRPLLSAVLAGGLLVALAPLRTPAPHGQARPDVPAVASRRADVQADAACVPRLRPAGQRGRQGRRRQLAHDEGRDPGSWQRALATGLLHEPITVDVNADATVANIAVPSDGNGTDSVSEGLRRAAAERDRAGDGRCRPRRRARAPAWRSRAVEDSTDEMTANLPLVVGFVLLSPR